MKSNDVFKKGQPEWLNTDSAEDSDSVFKKGQPEWLSSKLTQTIDDSATTPSWLEKDQDGNIIDKRGKHDYWNLTYLTAKQIDYCKARGIYKFLKGHKPKVVMQVLHQWNYTERRTGTIFTLDKIINSDMPMIREIAELNELEELESYLKKHNSIIEPDLELKLDFKFPDRKTFKFNIDAESQHYLCSHIVFDVETSKQTQQPVALGAYNYETNRLVIAVNSKLIPEKEGEFKLINDNIYLIYTPNLWEGVLIADIEMLLSTIYESALMEGHNDLTKLFIDLKLPKKLKIDTKILNDYVNGFPKRRSLWLAHNARFDIDMINHTNKQAKNKFTFLQKQLEHEKIPHFLGKPISKEKIKNNREIANKTYNVNAYVIHLGNTDAGFKFKVNLDNAGSKTIYRANVSPKQKKTFTQMWIADTFQLSLALQNPAHSLKALSEHHPIYKKIDYEELNFPVEHFDIIEHNKITKPVKYLIFDLFATLTAYEKITQDLNYAELQELIQKETPEFQLKTNWRPRVSSILSTASISKQFIFPYLEAKTGLKQKAIENNIIHERLHQSNFQKVYSGGVTEAIAYGILESDFSTNERVFYDDYESLYASVARLVFADLLYQLAASRKLHTKLTTDIDSARNDFWKIAENTCDIVRKSLKGKKSTLPENIFKELIGTVQIYTIHPIQIRTKNKDGKRCWKKVKGKISLHLIDLLNSIVRGCVEFNTDIHVLMSSIHFINVERYNFKNIKVSKFGNELFTLLLTLRRIKKQEKNTVEKMLKYIVNTAYGITAEGINNEDITGKLFIPAIFSSITAGARFLISLPEILIPKLNGIMAYTDTDSIIYKLKEELRSRITQLSKNLSILNEETDYGKIHKAFINKKKKYYLLSENINESKFKNQFIKLDNDLYIVGKIHGIASFDKELYTKAVFPMINDLLDNFTIEKPNITKTVKKHIHLHPRFSNLTYKKKTHSKIKGLLHFFQKTRRINVINNSTKEKTKVRITNPVISLYKTKYDIYDVYFYYDLSQNKILISNLSEKAIRSNFGIYANLGSKRVKMFYTIPIEEENQLEWENKFLKMIIDTLWSKFDSFWKNIALAQRTYILNFAKNTRNLMQDEYLSETPLKDENFNAIFDNWFGEFRCPIPKTKRFFDLDFKLYEFKNIKFNADTKNWYAFCEDYGDILTSEFEAGTHQKDIKSTIEEAIQSGNTNDIKLLNKLLSSLGLDTLILPSVRYMRHIASEYQIPDRSKMKRPELWDAVKQYWYRDNKPANSFQYLIERINEMMSYSPDGRLEWIIDRLFDTETVSYSDYLASTQERNTKTRGLTREDLRTMPKSWLEALGIENIEEYQEPELEKDELSVKDIKQEDLKNYIGYQMYEKFMNNTIEDFIKEAINKEDLTTKLIQQFSFKTDDFNRYISEEHERFILTAVPSQKKEEEHDEMLTHEILDQNFHTDGIDWTLTAYLPELDFSEELVANQNTFYTQNLINFSRIGTLIYYLTHNRADEIPKIWNTNPVELACPKSAKYVQIPLRMRYLPDITETTLKRNQIKQAFNSDELDTLLENKILEATNEKQDHFKVLNTKKWECFISKNILKRAYMVIGKKKPENHKELFPIYIERKFMEEAYAFEICTNRGPDFNSKLYIGFIVNENKNETKRLIRVDLHINPNSHNLMNIELFKANIKDIEANDFIVKELLLGLFTIKELAFFSRNASLTVSDMKKKEDLTYLRKIQYLFITHALLQDAIENNSQCKIGMIALTGQIKLTGTDPQTLFSYANTAIIQNHDEWIHSLEPAKAMQIQAREISTLPHRSSFGITTNHWKNGIHISLYTKDKYWYKAKVSRVARARNFEITPSLSKKIMEKVWDETGTVRFEITLKGFEAIHTKEYHCILKDLQQFFLQVNRIFQKSPEATTIFKKYSKKIKDIMPNPLFKTEYNTDMSKIIKETGEFIESYIDNSGYTWEYIETPNEEEPPDPD